MLVRTDHLTEYASLKLTNRIIVEMIKMKTSVNILFLDPKILLDKFEHYAYRRFI